MKLKDIQTLWGTPVVHLREHSRRYRFSTTLLYLGDIALVTILTAFMYDNHISYNVYGFVLVAICILFHFISYYKLNPDKWEAFKFYRNNSNYEVKEKCYKVDSENLHSILYCSGYMRLKKNCSFDNYKELMLSACCENIKYSKVIMKYLKKYESESGNLICYIIEKGKKQYLIDFKSDDDSSDDIAFSSKENEDINGGNLNGDDYSGTASEDDTE